MFISSRYSTIKKYSVLFCSVVQMIPYFSKKFLAGDINSLNLLVCSGMTKTRKVYFKTREWRGAKFTC